MTAICLVLTAPVSAGLYKWVDKDGKVHFTDDRSQIPLDNRNKKDMKKMEPGKAIKQSPKPAAPSPARKHLGAKKKSTPSRDAGIDKKKVKDLQRLLQKKHYNH